MARPLFAQLFTKPGHGSGEEEKRRKRRQAAARARGIGGVSGLIDKFDPIKKDEWGLQRQREQKVVSDQYFRDKQRLLVAERRAKENLRRQTEQRKREINSYYRVGKLSDDDPRSETARLKASQRYDRYQRKVERQHHRQWLKSFRKMKIQRNKQYHKITESMKKEHRRSRGLPDAMKGPWNI
jgi:hypothetical protein